jgi:hypothetical protein
MNNFTLCPVPLYTWLSSEWTVSPSVRYRFTPDCPVYEIFHPLYGTALHLTVQEMKNFTLCPLPLYTWLSSKWTISPSVRYRFTPDCPENEKFPLCPVPLYTWLSRKWTISPSVRYRFAPDCPLNEQFPLCPVPLYTWLSTKWTISPSVRYRFAPDCPLNQQFPPLSGTVLHLSFH